MNNNLFSDCQTILTGEHNAIFIFVENIDDIIQHTQRIINGKYLLDKGYLFFAYPKKGNKKYSTFVHRDEIFPTLKVGDDGYVEDSDLKFSRMVSMDDTFTVVGLKQEQKKSKKSTAASQCVADYENHIGDVKKLLTDYPNELAFYEDRTPGYQRDWARYIFFC